MIDKGPLLITLEVDRGPPYYYHCAGGPPRVGPRPARPPPPPRGGAPPPSIRGAGLLSASFPSLSIDRGPLSIAYRDPYRFAGRDSGRRGGTCISGMKMQPARRRRGMVHLSRTSLEVLSSSSLSSRPFPFAARDSRWSSSPPFHFHSRRDSAPPHQPFHSRRDSPRLAPLSIRQSSQGPSD